MAGFRDLADRLAELEGLPSRITSEVAGAINAEIGKQFADGNNAYGNAWKPLLPQTVKRKGGDARILRRTDALSEATRATPTSGSGIEIESLDYGSFHQSGTKRMVARKILPDGSALPKSWSDAIAEAASRAFAKVKR